MAQATLVLQAGGVVAGLISALFGVRIWKAIITLTAFLFGFSFTVFGLTAGQKALTVGTTLEVFYSSPEIFGLALVIGVVITAITWWAIYFAIMVPGTVVGAVVGFKIAQMILPTPPETVQEAQFHIGFSDIILIGGLLIGLLSTLFVLFSPLFHAIYDAIIAETTDEVAVDQQADPPDLDELSQQQRTLLKAVWYNPRESLKDIGTRMDMAPETVRDRLNELGDLNWEDPESRRAFTDAVFEDQPSSDRSGIGNLSTTQSLLRVIGGSLLTVMMVGIVLVIGRAQGLSGAELLRVVSNNLWVIIWGIITFSTILVLVGGGAALGAGIAILFHEVGIAISTAALGAALVSVSVTTPAAVSAIIAGQLGRISAILDVLGPLFAVVFIGGVVVQTRSLIVNHVSQM